MVLEVKEYLCENVPPGGRSPGFCELTVFRTRETFDADLGGLDGADVQCAQAAEAAGLTGTYVAWLSTTSVNAIDRLTEAPYVRVDGMRVADSKADLTDGTLENSISIDEDGSPAPGVVWTGTLSDGTAASETCEDWTAPSPFVGGRTGLADQTDARWTDNAVSGCDVSMSLYCFQQ